MVQNFKPSANIEKLDRKGLLSCGGNTRMVARNSWMAGGGGEAVGRQ